MVDVKIYSDGLKAPQNRQLIGAIGYVNGSQNHFLLSESVDKITLPEGEEIQPEAARDYILENTSEDGFKICVTSRPFDDNWFFHEYRTTAFISIAEWEEIFAPPSLKRYLMYEFALALGIFASDLSEEMALRLVHEPPEACLLDFCQRKPDIKLGMVAGNICPQCRAVFLQYGTPEEAIDAVERILKVVRSEAIGRPFLVEPKRAFVVMRFSEHDENDNTYRQGVKPGLEAVGIKVTRADDAVKSSQILDKIKNQIDKSRFILAKVDTDNLNVYFELGLAMGADKDVLLVSEEGLVLNLPSDLRNWECLTYKKGDYEELKEEISKFFIDNYGFKLIMEQ